MARDDRWLEVLNEPQRQAVRHGSDPLLILAGAGSGKTRVITYRIAYLLRQGIEPESILAVTFTNKAAGEMKERACLLESRAKFSHIRTFHSFCAWYLRHHAEHVGLSRSFTIYDEDDCARLIKSLNPNAKQIEQRQLVKGLSLLKDKGIACDDPILELEYPWAVELYPAYEKALLESNAVDFGGLILNTIRLLKENPEIEKRTRQRFVHILVDEFQDTNPLQFQLVRAMCPEGHWLTVVGDDDQSIYSFRGADVGNILNFQDHYPRTHIIRLEQNYRSTGHILAAASAMIAHNTRRLGKTLWTQDEDGNKVHIHWFATDQEEAAFAADFAQRNPNREFAILYRTNAQSRLFEQSLSRAGVRYRLVGGLSFYQREEIKDVLAYLAVLVNPKDNVSLVRIINKPRRGFGPAKIEKLLDAKKLYPDLKEAICRADLNKAAQNALLEFADMLDSLNRARKGRSLLEFLRELYDRTGLLKHYESIDDIEDTDRVGNLGELLTAAEQFDATDEGISRFLEQSALSRSDDEDDESRVVLITLHNAKGLEFENVLIAGVEEGYLPMGESIEQVEEERRLFYVGMTRARKLLMISGADLRFLWGRSEAREPSAFLGELPRDRIEFHGLIDGKGEEWSVGQRVFHPEYGGGYITEIKRKDVHHLLRILFDSGATTSFIAEYADLERVEHD